ncbi:hypothetical protein C5167_033194 [Papaver somniferum]|uniref:DUF4228 domain-containing protein n=1 Tax=Papaver somniferum TaxID=3469 RepID=A0A4Y7KAK8_PAPSO|nr:uncharacterized protein LOC113294533 [Papaver somniferum]RZC69005.1 hypothetical protein C5167_033194 [Papaver somniferum]
MKNSIRCCISCILPCGSLDVIRVIHSNGQVEEFSEIIRAGDLMKLNPKHVVRRSALPSEEGSVQKIIIMSRDAELKRGKIYFLVPMSLLPRKARARPAPDNNNMKINIVKREEQGSSSSSGKHPNLACSMNSKFLISSDQYLTEILSEKNISSTQRHRRSRHDRSRIWRPNLASISETADDL